MYACVSGETEAQPAGKAIIKIRKTISLFINPYPSGAASSAEALSAPVLERGPAASPAIWNRLLFPMFQVHKA